MKKITWTKADAKRAEKMGWGLDTIANPVICKLGDRFKSDDEAIEWVIDEDRPYDMPHLDYSTIRKALFLCAKG